MAETHFCCVVGCDTDQFYGADHCKQPANSSCFVRCGSSAHTSQRSFVGRVLASHTLGLFRLPLPDLGVDVEVRVGGGGESSGSEGSGTESGADDDDDWDGVTGDGMSTSF